MFELVSFYLFSTLIILSLLITIFSSNILYTMTALASGMIFISGIFFNLGAEFIGVVQISAYTGAIMALYAFGMMFFDSSKNVKENINHEKLAMFISVGIACILVIIMYLIGANKDTAYINIDENLIDINGNIERIGIILFTKYLVIFEVAAIMLLIAMVSGIALTNKKNQKENQ